MEPNSGNPAEIFPPEDQGLYSKEVRELYEKPISILVYRDRARRVVKGWENPFNCDFVCWMDCGVVMTAVPKIPVQRYGGIGVYVVQESEAMVFEPPPVSSAESVIAYDILGHYITIGR